MEALTACSVASLTIYDMCKSIDKKISITDIKLTYKTGGKTGTFKNDKLWESFKDNETEYKSFKENWKNKHSKFTYEDNLKRNFVKVRLSKK